MFPHLRVLLVTIWVFCMAGVVIAVGLALGNYPWTTFVWAGVIGVVIGVPAALANWAYLRPNRAREVGLTKR